MNEKKKLAFVDNSFHRVTGSAEFFQELLRSQYEVTLFFHESWQGGTAPDLDAVEKAKFDAVIFWQVLPRLHRISRLTCRNVIWVPMYDDEPYRSDMYWKALGTLGLKVIAFSRAVHEVAERFGLHSFYVQYFPEPARDVVSYGRPRVFSWQRSTPLGWTLLKRLLAENDIASVILRDDPDPGQLFDEPGPEDRVHFSIDVVRGLKLADTANNDAYLQLLSGSNVFMAPRSAEGIGMTFLEAMARGMCVVAPNAPTMNEYISSGENGYLFEASDPRPIDLSQFERWGRSARAYIAEGRRRWEASIPDLLNFIQVTSSTKRWRATRAVCLAWDVAYLLRIQAARLGLKVPILAKTKPSL